MKIPRKPITAAAGAIYARPPGKSIDNQKNSLRTKAVDEIKSPRFAKAIARTKPQIFTPTSSSAMNARKSKRNRLKTMFFQSPLPELDFISKLSRGDSMSAKDKFIVFYKHEFLALRNEEDSFFLCQTLQNVCRSSVHIKIRWLSNYKECDTVFILDYDDQTEIDCILTTVELKKLEKDLFRLPIAEKTRIKSILKRAIDVEKGILPRPDVTEDNPDGLDISLYKDESQIEKKSSRTGVESATKDDSTESTSSKINSGKDKSHEKKKMKCQSSGESFEGDDGDTDKEYKPSCKKAIINSTIEKAKPKRPQRSALAKARAASPIISTTYRSIKHVPQTIDTSVSSGLENTISTVSTSVTEAKGDAGSQRTVNELTVSTINPIQNLQHQHQHYQYHQHQLPQPPQPAQPVEYQHYQRLLPQPLGLDQQIDNMYLLYFGTGHPHTSSF